MTRKVPLVSDEDTVVVESPVGHQHIVAPAGASTRITLRLGPMPEEVGRLDDGVIAQNEAGGVRRLVKALTRTY